MDSSGYVLFYSKTTVEAFARQTISDPNAWPHYYDAQRKYSEQMSIMQSEESILKHQDTSPKFKKPSVRKTKKIQVNVDEGKSLPSLQSLQSHNRVIQRDLFHRALPEQNIQINNIQINNIIRAASSQDIQATIDKSKRRPSKVKQSVMIRQREALDIPNPSWGGFSFLWGLATEICCL